MIFGLDEKVCCDIFLHCNFNNLVSIDDRNIGRGMFNDIGLHRTRWQRRFEDRYRLVARKPKM